MYLRFEVYANGTLMNVVVAFLYVVRHSLFGVSYAIVRLRCSVCIEEERGGHIGAPVVGKIESVSEGDAYAEHFDA